MMILGIVLIVIALLFAAALYLGQPLFNQWLVSVFAGTSESPHKIMVMMGSIPTLILIAGIVLLIISII